MKSYDEFLLLSMTIFHPHSAILNRYIYQSRVRKKNDSHEETPVHEIFTQNSQISREYLSVPRQDGSPNLMPGSYKVFMQFVPHGKHRSVPRQPTQVSYAAHMVCCSLLGKCAAVSSCHVWTGCCLNWFTQPCENRFIQVLTPHGAVVDCDTT